MKITNSHADADADADEDSLYWQEAFSQQCIDWSEELQRFRLPAPLVTTQSAPCTVRQLAGLNPVDWAAEHHPRIEQVRSLASKRLQTLERLAALATKLAQMDFSLLYDNQRDLFVIGYNTEERRLDSG